MTAQNGCETTGNHRNNTLTFCAVLLHFAPHFIINTILHTLQFDPHFIIISTLL